ncbi:colicin E3/pyocin S6 family cytotoxin [endosymbiont GvMRE of Glomus versiforme]|uniref:colicin E3/pyocin S6 family cytotoxin n=1 Tax=endosymbiont GvMRE of Glomus versiforme TaxID=2039283 RepID=UPI000ECA24B6|nr:colicin E3/pyocin S6 family cytotoxin [endosymbiont GvMRE of Glomus versiforme]RHZ35548.1 Cytotoxic domain protein [endosymbiont GvMRE of Glomus versiforme]
MPFFLALIPITVELVEAVQTVVVVGAAVAGARAIADVAQEVVERIQEHNETTDTSVQTERKTIYDWWCNGLTSEERKVLLGWGYSDKGTCYSLKELKDEVKYRERNLLPQQSQTYIQQWREENDYSSGEERKQNKRIVNPSKKNSPVWKGLKYKGRDRYGDKVMTNGRTGSKERLYQWDDTHNDIEVFSDSGNKHLGSMDPRTGKMYKGPKFHTIDW